MKKVDDLYTTVSTQPNMTKRLFIPKSLVKSLVDHLINLALIIICVSDHKSIISCSNYFKLTLSSVGRLPLLKLDQKLKHPIPITSFT